MLTVRNRMKISELSERYQKQIAAQVGVSRAVADLESRLGHASLAKEAPPRFDGPVGIRIVEYRHRLADPDGACAKYLLDAIISAGVLPDDSAKFVKKIEKEQIKVGRDKSEMTVVEIERGDIG